MNYPANPAEKQTFCEERNQAVVRAQAMTADQLFQEGFKHGSRNRGMRGSLCDYPEYQRGWSAGYDRSREWQEEF